MEKQLIPLLRFSEFKGNWNENILDEIATFSKGKGISKADIDNNGKYECIRYGELYTVYSETINEVKSKTNLSKNELVFSEENDIIIPASGETQIDIATASCVLRKGIALGGDLNIIRTKTNGVFLSYYLNNRKKHEIAKLSQGISVVHLYGSQLKSLKINLPKSDEQQKIASFLTSIDEQISLLTQQKEKLELYKKGVIQDLFSQEMRFKDKNNNDFSDWEEKKLGEIGFFQTSSIDKLTKDNEKSVFLVNYMNVYRHENINNKTVKSFQIVSAKNSQIESCNLNKGDILFTPSSETPDDIGHSVVIFEDLENTVFSYHLMRFRPTIELDILYSHYFCNVPNVLEQLSKYATGSTRFTISVGNFSKVKIQLPCFEEQQKIASFLAAIDVQIEKVNSQKDITLDFKKGLLQQMFV